MPQPQKVSLKEVAEMAGVSAMTASRVLAGKSNVSPKLTKAVKDAAQTLGYQSNPLVQRVMSELRRGNSHSLTGIIAFINASSKENDWKQLPYLKPFYEGIQDRTTSTGFALDEIWIRQPGWHPGRTKSVLDARGVQGIIIVPGSDPSQLDFPMDKFALASFGGLAFDYPIHQVLPDYFHNYVLCYRKLREHGYQRIGTFLPSYEVRITTERAVGGFLSAQWADPGKKKIPVGGGPKFWSQAKKDFLAWVKKEKPDAIIAGYNEVDDWLKEIGYEVPRNIGLVHPGLAEDVEGWAGVDTNRYEQGSQAVDLLTGQIFRDEAGFPQTPKRLTIKGHWTEGQTIRTKP
ncbi:MAG: LacI family DNA-binding transcriptional regulator [Opitutales bacterium]|nr:LacI family DNA-binding transcriptional regulator [Opitutales bacterium]